MDRQEAIDQLRQAAMSQHKKAVDTIEGFREQLLTNPVYAFEWADQHFMAAAEIEEARRLLHGLESVENEETAFDVDGVLDAMKRGAAQNLLHQIGGSTSQSQNLMDKAKAVLARNWLEDNYFSQSYLVREVMEVTGKLS